jgi:hypothetical protein
MAAQPEQGAQSATDSPGRGGVSSEDAGRVLSPGNRGEEADFDPSSVFDDRAAFGEFHGFSKVVGRDECVAAERQWRSARADGCPLEDRVAEVHQVGAELLEPGFPGGSGVGGADVVPGSS